MFFFPWDCIPKGQPYLPSVPTVQTSFTLNLHIETIAQGQTFPESEYIQYLIRAYQYNSGEIRILCNNFRTYTFLIENIWPHFPISNGVRQSCRKSVFLSSLSPGEHSVNQLSDSRYAKSPNGSVQTMKQAARNLTFNLLSLRIVWGSVWGLANPLRTTNCMLIVQLVNLSLLIYKFPGWVNNKKNRTSSSIR